MTPAECPLTTHQALSRAATIGPDVEAVVSTESRVTYAELADDVATLRSALAAAGVRHGDHVGICLGNGARWAGLFLAITSLGAVAVPINTRFRQDELAFALRQSRVTTLFTADRLLSTNVVVMLRRICPGIDRALPDSALPDLTRVVVVGTDVPAGARAWDEFMQGATAPVEPAADPDDVALIQYTSGTTSYPKGVLLTHRSICANAYISGSWLGLRVADRFLSARPFFHVAGTTLSIMSCTQHATTLVTMPRFEAGEALRLLESEACTHFSGNDTIALMLLNHPDRPARRLALRGAWVAASPSIVRRVADELGAHECVVGYGLSEASPNVAQSRWWDDRKVRMSGRMRVQPGVEVRIRRLSGDGDCTVGDVGEILVRGWNVMRGYFDMPHETALALSDKGWLATGDLGTLDEDGLLTFVGRLKELIRVGGENVAPAEVEDVLHRHPSIRQAVVVGVPDERLIEVPFAFVTVRGGSVPDQNDIIAWARDRIAGFKVPRYVHVVDSFDELGMTASSKVQRRRIAAHAAEMLRSATP